MKKLENIDIKNCITLVALLLWIGITVYGLLNNEFANVFDYFKEVFMMIVSFYLGTKVSKTTEVSEAVTESEDSEPTTQDFE